jgi:hypothetical protein
LQTILFFHFFPSEDNRLCAQPLECLFS